MAQRSFYAKIRSIIGSSAFFYALAVLFLISAVWLVFTARYPMAFDENYHYGIIKVYSHQLSPFINHPPAGTESFGDITRYPSYLYHYLMSFPYRLIGQFTSVEQTKIIFLRLINVGFFMIGLVYFRKLLLLSKAGPAVTNTALLFFTLVPNVVFLAAHINYDNLLVPLTAAIVYFGLQLIYAAQKGTFDTGLFIKMTTLNLLTTLVVFTHLPIFFATEVFVVGFAIYSLKKRRKPLLKGLLGSFQKQKTVAKWFWVSLLVLSSILFLERYGLNQLRYHNLIPDCGQVISQESCKQYGPWGRDFKLMKVHPNRSDAWGDGRYFLQWAGQTMYEMFFTINYNYFNKAPLVLPFVTAWVITVTGTLAIVFNWKRFKASSAYLFFGFVVGVYGISLWINNIHRFRRVGFPVAIHGRYWMQLLPLVFVLMILGYKFTAQRLPKNLYAKLTILPLLAALLLFIQGGGITSYLVSSDVSWYWPNMTVVRLNNSARQILQRVILH